MTGPASPASDHLDLDALADVLAGERTDDPHLGTCAACGERLAALSAAQARVVAALAALPEPVLPGDVEARLKEAVRTAARSQALDATGATAAVATGAPGPTPSSRRATVTPLRRRRSRAWAPAAAASLVLVLGAGLGYAVVGGSGPVGGGDGGEAATSAAGGAAESDQAESDQADSDQAESDQAESDQAESDQADPDQADSDQAESDQAESDRTASGDEGSAGTTSVAAPPRSATGTDYADEAQRTTALRGLLAAEGPDSPGFEEGRPDPARLPSPDPLARLRDPSALAACLSAITQDGPAPLAVDEGQYADAPALAVVLPASDPGEVVVHVVGTDCTAQDADTLLVVPVPRP